MASDREGRRDKAEDLGEKVEREREREREGAAKQKWG